MQCKFTEDFLDEIPGMEILIKIELKNHEKIDKIMMKNVKKK